MAQKELALYVAEQLAPLGEIRYIPRRRCCPVRFWKTAGNCVRWSEKCIRNSRNQRQRSRGKGGE